MTSVQTAKSFLISFGLAVSLSLVEARASQTSPSMPGSFGQYREAVTDLRVKVLGGYLSVDRTWYGHERRWLFFPKWEERFTLDPAGSDGHPDVIRHGKVRYVRRPGSEPPKWRSADRTIEYMDGRYRWQDTDGGWIEFDGLGRVLGIGSRYVTIGTVRRDAGGLLVGLVDENDLEVITVERNAAGDVVRATDYSGREILYGVVDGRLTTVTDVRANPWIYTYDEHGRLRTKTNPNGRVTTISYSEDGLLHSIFDQDGFGAEYRYGHDSMKGLNYEWVRWSGGLVEETWKKGGAVVRRDVNGRTVESHRKEGEERIVEDEHGNETRYLRYRIGSQKTTYADGAATIRWGSSRPSRIADENGTVTHFTYDDVEGGGFLNTITEAAYSMDQRITERTFDASGQLVTQRQIVDYGDGDRVTTFSYDPFGNIASLTDAEGYLTLREHDVQGNVVKQTDSRGNEWLYEYDGAGKLVRSENPLGHEASYEYDGMGNLVRHTDETDAETVFVYNRQNRLVEQIDALGHSWRYDYDDAGRMVEASGPAGRILAIEYDPRGRVTRIVDGAGNTTSVEYLEGSVDGMSGRGRLERVTFPTFTQERQFDSRGRLVEEALIDGAQGRRSTRYTYDRKGNLVATTFPDGRTQRAEYDPYDRLIEFVRTNGLSVRINRARWDGVVSIIDPRWSRIQHRFDKLGRRISETRDDGGVTTYEYDGVGNLLRIVDPRGMVVAYTYDAAGRRIEARTYATPSDTTPTRTISYSYNARGDLTGYVDGDHSATYTIDALGRRTAEEVDFGPFTKTTQTTYDPAGRQDTFTGPDGVTYTYEHDSGGRLRSIGIPGEGKIVYQAYDWASPTRVLLPGGTVQEYEYDDLLRMTRVRSTDPAGNVILDQQYDRNETGRVIARQTEAGNYSYGYDDAYQLTSATSDELPDEQYTYDDAGNRLPADPALQALWNYNADNELIATDSATYEYDAAGNRVREIGPHGERRYVWDEYGRLSRVEDGAGQVIATYRYDPYARRLWKDAAGTRTYFAYANEGLVGELSSAGTVQRSYGYAPGSLWTTRPLFVAEAEVAYLHHDQIGAPQAASDRTGALRWKSAYSAFGEADEVVAGIAQPLRLPGQYFDAESGLHQNWFRYYDPQVGRFLTEDPVPSSRFAATRNGVHGLHLLEVNQFAYVANQPLNAIDPDGQAAIPLLPLAAVTAFSSCLAGAAQEIADAYSSCDPEERAQAYANAVDGCIGGLVFAATAVGGPAAAYQIGGFLSAVASILPSLYFGGVLESGTTAALKGESPKYWEVAFDGLAPMIGEVGSLFRLLLIPILRAAEELSHPTEECCEEDE